MDSFRLIQLYALIFCAFCPLSLAETIIVDPNGSGDFTNIQDAINYSWHGDTIIVNPGVYPENLRYDSRAILLTSADPNDPNVIANTIIQGTVTFDFNEGLESILTGFKIAPVSGDGVVCYGNSTTPIIEKNIITGCDTAILCQYNAAPYILSNTIEYNGNGIVQCEGRIENNIIRFNDQWGIWNVTSIVTGNTIENNQLGGINGIVGDVIGNTIINNSGWNGAIVGVIGKVEDNYIVNNQGCGISDCEGDIINNTISGNEVGLSSCGYPFHEYLIYQNEISNNTGDGLNWCEWAIIYENTISNNGGDGLYYCGSDIRDNIISGNTGNGLSECSGSITRNVITGNNQGIHCCDAIIEENHIVNNGAEGIVGHPSYDEIIVKNNLIAGNKSNAVSYCTNVLNNTIVENLGHGIYECSDAIIKNNIIAYNDGVGIYEQCNNSYNCFWQNAGGSFYNNYAKIGDQYMNPLFAILGSWIDDVWTQGDYTLLSEYGRWDDDTDIWVIDAQTSPCINNGDPNDGILHEPNPNGARINMGAYGGTEYASKSDIDGPDPVNPPVIPAVCVDKPSMDTNDDCKIDLLDFAEFASQWMTCGYDIQDACWE